MSGALTPAPAAAPAPETCEASTRAPSPGSVRAEWRRRRPKAVPIPQAEAARQGAITQIAFLLLGREPAIAFLNTVHEGLGGRPLALATASAEGRAAVEAELARMTYRPLGEGAPAQVAGA